MVEFEYFSNFLTYKLVILLALTSAARSCTSHALSVNYMCKSKEGYTFKFHKLHKGWRKGNPSPSITFKAFAEDNRICVVETLAVYIERSKQWRKDPEGQLLLSYVEPHKKVVSSTISGWIKAVLKLAGIDVETFKGHSTRAASTSKAGSIGLSIQDILSRGSWSNESTWQRFYHKPIVSSQSGFQNSVLKGAL